MPSASTHAKRDKSFALRPNDLISARECNALITTRLRQFQRRIVGLIAAGFVGLVIALAVALAIGTAK